MIVATLLFVCDVRRLGSVLSTANLPPTRFARHPSILTRGLRPRLYSGAPYRIRVADLAAGRSPAPVSHHHNVVANRTDAGRAFERQRRRLVILKAEVMDSETDTLDDEPEVETPAKRRRRQAGVAEAGEPIPPSINAAFPEALAYERAVSVALDLASGVNSSSDLTAGAHRAVWGRNDPPELAWRPTPQAGALSLHPQTERQRMNASRTIDLATLTFNPAHTETSSPRKRTPA
jgi:hypothetical protein